MNHDMIVSLKEIDMGYIKDKLNKEPSSIGQRKKIVDLCVEHELIGRKDKYTGPEFRDLFKLVFTPVPKGDEPWPAMQAWVDGLSMTQAKTVISYIMYKHPRSGRDNFLFGSYRSGW